MTLLIYGANGYTGALTANMAVEQGMRPILAGRSAQAVAELAAVLQLEHRVFSLDDPAAVDAGIAGVKVVLHCAGPFSRTARPMADACLRHGVHYLDITGEIPVFEELATLDRRAKEAGIMLLPGAGFDVVPSDCLAALLARQMPDAKRLVLAIGPVGGAMSHGTATTMVENLHRGGAVRRGGRLVPMPPGKLWRSFDFGRGPETAMAIPWGDLATAWRSTGIPDIEVYVRASRMTIAGARIGGLLGPILGLGPVQRMLKRRVAAMPAGPTDEQRARARSILLGEVYGSDGRVKAARLEVAEGYTLTALASLEIARRVLDGQFKPGFQTPSLAFGADFVTGLPGTRLVEL